MGLHMGIYMQPRPPEQGFSAKKVSGAIRLSLRLVQPGGLGHILEELGGGAGGRVLQDRHAVRRPEIAQERAFESWAAQYAALLADARTRYGDDVVDGLRSSDPVGKTSDEQYTHLRDRVRLQARIAQLQSATLDAVAQQLGGEAAPRLSTYDKSYYYGRLKP